MDKQSVKFTIIDEIMGGGKTTRAFKEINDNPDKRYLFVTLLLDELKRFEKACDKVEIFFPKEKDETGSKFENFKKLIPHGENIGITHVMFQMIDNEAIELLREQNYILIIDETIDCIQIQQDISQFETKVLFESGLLLFDKKTGLVSWNHEQYPEIQGWKMFDSMESNKIKKWCDDGALNFEPDKDKAFEDYQGKFIWMLPPDIFSCFKDIRVLTYQFENTFMELYLKINQFDYEIQAMDAGEENQRKTEIKDLVRIVDWGNYNATVGQFRLTHSFYNEITKEDAEGIGKKCDNLIRNIQTKEGTYINDIVSLVMWTCPKSAANKIVGVTSGGKARKNRKKARYFNNLDHKIDKKKKPTYMYSNARATNVYSHKTIALYLINRYMNPNLIHYFEKKGFSVSKEIEGRFATNELIQWVWRSAIRNNKPITLFLPSKRMRDLFMVWLNSRREEKKEPLGSWDNQRTNKVVYIDESEFYNDDYTVVKYVHFDGTMRLKHSHEIPAKCKISRATKEEVELYEAGEPLSMTEYISRAGEPVRYAQWGYSRAEGVSTEPWTGDVGGI